MTGTIDNLYLGEELKTLLTVDLILWGLALVVGITWLWMYLKERK